MNYFTININSHSTSKSQVETWSSTEPFSSIIDFVRFTEYIEFTEFPLHLRKTPLLHHCVQCGTSSQTNQHQKSWNRSKQKYFKTRKHSSRMHTTSFPSFLVPNHPGCRPGGSAQHAQMQTQWGSAQSRLMQTLGDLRNFPWMQIPKQTPRWRPP